MTNPRPIPMKTRRRKLPPSVSAPQPGAEVSTRSRASTPARGGTYVEPDGVIAFTVIGLPKAQPRARVVRNASTRGKARAYTPDEDGTLALWRQKVQLLARAALQGRRFTGPVFLSVLFVLPSPKDCKAARWCTTKPDLDNLVKAVKDALTELGAWNDDSQVASCQLAKVQLPGAKHTGAHIELERLGDEHLAPFLAAIPRSFELPPPSGGTPA